MSDCLWPHELQHARPPCPSPTPKVHPNSCPSSRWFHPAISSSVVPFSSCPQSQQTGKFWKRWEYQATRPASWETCMPVRKQQLEQDMEHWNQWTFPVDPNWERIISRSPCSFSLYADHIMRNDELDEAQAQVMIAGRNINNLRYSDDTTRMAERGTEEPLDESERGELKSCLKTEHSKP